MSLRVDRQTGDIIENEDINAIAAEINRISEALESDSGTSGSLIVRTASLATIPAGSTEGKLVGYRNSSFSPITIAGHVLQSGDWAVWGWFGGSWTLLTKSSSAPPDPTPPVGGVLTASAVTGSAFTLTVKGASDPDSGLHPQPYRFSTDGGVNWSTWQAANAYTATAAPETTYNVRAQVRNADGAAATLATDPVTTPYDPNAPVFSETFSRPDDTVMAGLATEVGGYVYIGSASWLSGLGSPASTQLVAQNGKCVSNTGNNSAYGLGIAPNWGGTASSEMSAAIDYDLGAAVGNSAGLKFFRTGYSNHGYRVRGDGSFIKDGSLLEPPPDPQPRTGTMRIVWTPTQGFVYINDVLLDTYPVTGPRPESVSFVVGGLDARVDNFQGWGVPA